MKKVKFVSGFNAKVALAACAVAGFSLTGCDEEDFTVDVPNINVSTTTPDVTIGGDTIILGNDTIIFPSEEGAAYLVLTTTASTGETLGDVAYTITDAEGNVLYDDETTSLTLRVPTEATYTVVAAKTGYYSNQQVVSVPSVPDNQMLTVPVNIVLEAVDLDEEEVTANVSSNNEDMSEGEPLPASYYSVGPLEAGTYETTLPNIPDATPYLTDEQKEALYEAIDALDGPVTRAMDDDLTVAKDLLRASVNAYRSTPSKTGSITVSYTVTEAAASVQFIVTTAQDEVKITFSVWVNSYEYAVEGECTVPGESTVTTEAEGVNISHSHDHGSSSTAGGGVVD